MKRAKVGDYSFFRYIEGVCSILFRHMRHGKGSFHSTIESNPQQQA